jgi:hypothetical protein
MLSWFTNYFYTWYSGPARNAPNDGINIKKFIESKPADIKLIAVHDLTDVKNKLKPVDTTKTITTYFCITPKELQQTKLKLHNTKQTNKSFIFDTIQPHFEKNKNLTPLMQEFNTVFELGYKNYFEQKKKKH